MSESARRSWIPAVILLGVLYALVGSLFALPSTHVQVWRLAAWLVSAVGYAAHIANERFRRQDPPAQTALHVALAVALGAFGLALGANVHSLSVASNQQQRQLLLLALGIWPVISAAPAFLVALAIGAVLARLARKVPAK
jgi:hypothetical protein